MADLMTPTQRSSCMSKIKGKNTRPELMLRKSLWREGLRYRLNSKLPGKPDMVFVSKKVAIFVDGCFWHCCPEHGSKPKSNESFWHKKLQRNIERDIIVNEQLHNKGWSVCRIWEHEVEKNISVAVDKIKLLLS